MSNLSIDRSLLFTAVDPEINGLSHVRLSHARIGWTALEAFRAIEDRHDVTDATVLVDNLWALQNTFD